MKTQTNRPFKQDQPKLKVDLGNNTIQNIVIVLLFISAFITAFTFA